MNTVNTPRRTSPRTAAGRRHAGEHRRAGRRRVRHRLQGQLDPRPGPGARRGRHAYPTPAGASGHPLGGLGFANWAYEVERQERELGVFFDTIVVCSVTGSTQAGMIAGFAGQDRPRRVLGIDGSAKPAETHAQVAKIARNTAELIGLGPGAARRGDHPAGGLGGGPLWRPGGLHPRRHPPHRRPGGRDPRPGLRGQVHGRAHLLVRPTAREH
ncbi:1-aminocyclopropane-1-carboxylate deaminase [Streptomyces himastatinicus ATCC 53653]|uniref:1-aminocyclopropane-1-carboxylate deaminase n=1 Tax=Streptomyces himastatinicus ATCC 53653 TaxID=457427 RepID=D9WV87_9ACTN|nr:1-aminocyclopropane-1-carboxylate deaminase [Streptomyces himastatinicus ATCC 53653]